MKRSPLLAAWLLLSCCLLVAQTSPQANLYYRTAIRFAGSEIKRFPQAWQLDHGKRLYFGYAQSVGAMAMLQLWERTGNRSYYEYVQNWTDSLIDSKGHIYSYKKKNYHLDFIAPGKVLLAIYAQNHKPNYRTAIENLTDQLRTQPRTSDGGYWHKDIYPNQMWLDGIYMAAPFMARYGKEFNLPEWIDEAIKQTLLCHTHCYDSITGLYYHAWDATKTQKWANPVTGQSPNFWGRSIGWYYMALVDVLDYVPRNHPGRKELITIIRKLSDILPRYQRNGLWSQIIDQPERKGNYTEASVNTQLMYAYAKAINKGYLPVSYKKIPEACFRAISTKLLKTNSDSTLTLTQCCSVAGLGGVPYRDGSYEYYIGENIRENDAKATGPFIMGCLELAAIKR